MDDTGGLGAVGKNVSHLHSERRGRVAGRGVQPGREVSCQPSSLI